MPIRIPEALPAASALEQENIFVMGEHRASHQDIRPLQILILNLMPQKIVTETQILRLLSNTPLQVDITLLQMASHTSKNTAPEHLWQFYKVFDDVKDRFFDGLIITGAPVEQLPFEQVDYWQELCRIMDWSLKHVYSTFHICWGAQAGLYYHFGIEKKMLPQKLFGVFAHRVLEPKHNLLRGFDEIFLAPHSRYTTVPLEQIEENPSLRLLTVSDEAGAHIISDTSGRLFFVTGHSEYDCETLKNEYTRDQSRGMDTAIPKHYFPQDDPRLTPPFVWRSHANLLFSNWLNHVVYQNTPYRIGEIVPLILRKPARPAGRGE